MNNVGMLSIVAIALVGIIAWLMFKLFEARK